VSIQTSTGSGAPGLDSQGSSPGCNHASFCWLLILDWTSSLGSDWIWTIRTISFQIWDSKTFIFLDWPWIYACGFLGELVYESILRLRSWLLEFHFILDNLDGLMLADFLFFFSASSHLIRADFSRQFFSFWILVSFYTVLHSFVFENDHSQAPIPVSYSTEIVTYCLPFSGSSTAICVFLLFSPLSFLLPTSNRIYRV